MIHQLWNGFCDLVFPRNCLCCRRYAPNSQSPPVCDACLSAIEFNAPPFCLKCSRHLDKFFPDGLCATCRHHPVAFDSAWSAALFNNELRHLIHLFKYQQKTSLRQVFSNITLKFLQDYKISLNDYDNLIPVPLHPTRLRERGFNQAQLLGQIISEKLNIPLETRILNRARFTHTQTELSRKQRFTNLEGAFRIGRDQYVKGKKCLLIDDLLTTGATASSAALTLKEAGATRVDVLTVAITS